MSGSIRYLAHRGCWQARVYDANLGRERSKVFGHGVPTIRAARSLSHAVLAELQVEVEDYKTEAGTVAEFAHRWVKRKKRDLSPTTIAGGYQLITDRIVERFGPLKLDALRRSDVRDWLEALRDTRITEATVQRHHAVLRAMFADALEDELIDRSPIPRQPRVRRRNLDLPAPAAIAELLAKAEGDFGRFVRLASLTGMRRGELIGLRWSDIEPAADGMAVIHVRRSVFTAGGGELGVKRPKSERERTVLVGPDGAAVVAEQLASVAEQMSVDVPHDGAVFADVRRDQTGGTPRQPMWVTRRWARFADRHGVKMRLHDLRHAHASRLVAAGVDVRSIADRMGHADAAMTLNVYAHATTAGAIEAARASER